MVWLPPFPKRLVNADWILSFVNTSLFVKLGAYEAVFWAIYASGRTIDTLEADAWEGKGLLY